MLEKHGDFLRDFRGDTVHPSTMDVLSELGWLDGFLERPHQKLARIRVHVGEDEVTIADFTHLPTVAKYVAFMPQWEFLDYLVQRGRELPGFSIRMNTEVTDLVEENGRVVGLRARTHAGERGERDDRGDPGERGDRGDPGELEIRADLVLAADGRSSLVRERAGLPVRDVGAPIDVLWLRLSRRADDPEQSLGWVRRGRFMVLLDRGEYWQIAFVIAKGGFDAVRAGGIAAFRRDLAAIVPFLGDRVDELKSFDDVKLLAVKVDRLERWWRPGLLCIGDAAHAMSPIGGVGINLAIQDAVAAANLLGPPLARGVVSDADLASVQRRREWPARATQAGQVVIQNRFLRRVLAGEGPMRAGPAVKMLDRVPWLRRIPAYLLGVGVRPEHVKALGPALEGRHEPSRAR